MGILRIREAPVEELIEKDPYELFTLDEPHHLARKLRPEVWLAACVGMVAAFALAVAAFWSIASGRSEPDDRPYAFFEIKAIDGDGRPVAGAVVRDEDKPLGVTDSYGEWRRFLRVRPGATLAFSISKRTAGGATISAVKNMAVPPVMPESGELELTGSIQLGKASGQAIAMPRRKASSADDESVTARAQALEAARAEVARLDAARLDTARLDTAVGLAAASRDTVRQDTVRQDTVRQDTVRQDTRLQEAGTQIQDTAPLPPPRLEIGSLAASAPASAGAAAGALTGRAPAAATKPAPPEEISFDAVWFMADSAGLAQTPGSLVSTPTSRLAEVLASLKRRGRELGLRITPDAAWRLTLRHLETSDPREPAADGKSPISGLVQVEASYQTANGSERLFTYLRNYQEDSLQTARDILWSTTRHVRKAHRAYRDGARWFLREPSARLWQLASGRILEDGNGKLHKVIVDPAGSGTLLLAPSANEPCGGASECDLTTTGVQRLPPIGGWQRLKLKVLGPLPPDLDLYVSGYQARPRGNAVFEYWGLADGAANLTAVRGGKVLHRERIAAGMGGPAAVSLTVSFPQAPISRR